MGINTEGKFNVVVGALIEHKASGKILLIKRSDKADFTPGIWEYAMGRVKQFEGPLAGLKREEKEETGLDAEIIKPVNIFHLFRGEEKTADNELIGIVYWCASQSDQVKLSGEHTEYKWLEPPAALELVSHEGVKKDIAALMREKK